MNSLYIWVRIFCLVAILVIHPAAWLKVFLFSTALPWQPMKAAWPGSSNCLRSACSTPQHACTSTTTDGHLHAICSCWNWPLIGRWTLEKTSPLPCGSGGKSWRSLGGLQTYSTATTKLVNCSPNVRPYSATWVHSSSGMLVVVLLAAISSVVINIATWGSRCFFL